MTILLIVSVFLVFITYWFARSANQQVGKDSLEAYRTMELAIIAGFIAYLALGMVTILLYIKI